MGIANALRFYWPWCGRPLRDHDWYFARKLQVLGDLRCSRCDVHVLYNHQEQSGIPWDGDADRFFDRMLSWKGMQR